jgi:hypothetical protein
MDDCGCAILQHSKRAFLHLVVHLDILVFTTLGLKVGNIKVSSVNFSCFSQVKKMTLKISSPVGFTHFASTNPSRVFVISYLIHL